MACHRSVGGGCVRASLASTAAKLTPRGARSDPMPLPNPRTKCRFARGNAAHGRLSAPLARRHMLQLHTRSCAGLVSSSLATSISAPPQRHRPTAAGRQRCGRPPLGAGGAADGKSAISPTSDLTSPHLTHCFLTSPLSWRHGANGAHELAPLPLYGWHFSTALFQRGGGDAGGGGAACGGPGCRVNAAPTRRSRAGVRGGARRRGGAIGAWQGPARGVCKPGHPAGHRIQVRAWAGLQKPEPGP